MVIITGSRGFASIHQTFENSEMDEAFNTLLEWETESFMCKWIYLPDSSSEEFRNAYIDKILKEYNSVNINKFKE